MKNLIVKSLLVLLLAGISLSLLAAEVRVTGIGRAPGERKTAREQALADALRDAVNKGVGVDLISSTNIKDFVLDYDRIFSASTGYIRDYRVISRNIGGDGLYEIKIEATIGKGVPETNQRLAIMQLIRRKGSPRILIESTEQISGTTGSDNISRSVLEELATGMGFQVVDQEAVNSASNKRSGRDNFLNDKMGSEARDKQFDNISDFIIRIRTSGKLGSPQETYGVKTRNLALGVEMSAIYPETGELIAKALLPTASVNAKQGMAPVDAPDQLTRFYLMRLLQGKANDFKRQNANTIFRKIMARWITELDLGAKLRLEFKGIDRKRLDQLIAKLQDCPGVGYAGVRQFDSRLISTVEVESRLNARQLKDEVLKHLPGFTVDCYSNNFLQFIPEKLIEKTGAKGYSELADKPADIPVWIYIVIGVLCAVILIMVGVFLGMRK